jgi:hypothetical protein
VFAAFVLNTVIRVAYEPVPVPQSDNELASQKIAEVFSLLRNQALQELVRF